jgi:asparagine synthase (glutamine-hydrolysing)
MCGIVGFLGGENTDPKFYRSVVDDMSNAIIQRGPDSSGIWCEVEKKIAFGHRRLAILDLSEAGQQPMISESRRYVITYNGEIYNSEEIKKTISFRESGACMERIFGHRSAFGRI